MDAPTLKRIDLLEQWIRTHRKDLIGTTGKISSSAMAKVDGLNSNASYWSDVFRRATTRSFAASSARDVEAALGMPHLLLEGSGWPFEGVDFERWDRLSERQKGRIEKAVNDELDRIEAEHKQANGTQGP